MCRLLRFSIKAMAVENLYGHAAIRRQFNPSAGIFLLRFLRYKSSRRFLARGGGVVVLRQPILIRSGGKGLRRLIIHGG